jgi:hypothetical protein
MLDIKGQRDSVVHGMWGEDRGKTGATLIGKKGNTDKPMDYGKLKDLALQIDKICVSLTDTFLDASSPTPGKDVTVTEAWAIMKK